MTLHLCILQENGWVNVNSIVEYLVGNANTINNYQINNEIKEEYINYVKAMPKENYSAMSFDYGIDIAYNFYSNNITNIDSSICIYK